MLFVILTWIKYKQELPSNQFFIASIFLVQSRASFPNKIHLFKTLSSYNSVRSYVYHAQIIVVKCTGRHIFLVRSIQVYSISSCHHFLFVVLDILGFRWDIRSAISNTCYAKVWLALATGVIEFTFGHFFISKSGKLCKILLFR